MSAKVGTSKCIHFHSANVCTIFILCTWLKYILHEVEECNFEDILCPLPMQRHVVKGYIMLEALIAFPFFFVFLIRKSTAFAEISTQNV